MVSIDVEQVREHLLKAIDPVFQKSIQELGTLEALSFEGDKVQAKIRITTPSDELKRQFQKNIEEAVSTLGALHMEIEWDVKVPTREAVSEDPLPSVKNIILVMSGKGGVGKSTVAANLALALKRMGTRVGLLDADIYGPSVPTMLGIMGRPVSKDGKRISPLERFGLKLMSVGFLLEDDKQAVIWRGPMLHGALQQLLTDVDWGELDYLILDLPPGTGDVALTLAQKAKITGCVMVTTPQEVALQDVYKAVSMCGKLNLPILGIVENMSFFVDSAGVEHKIFGEGGGEKIAEFSKSELLGQIPMDTPVRQWGDQGMPIVQAAPETSSAKAFTHLAEKLAEKVAQTHFEREGGASAPKSEGPKRLQIVR